MPRSRRSSPFRFLSILLVVLLIGGALVARLPAWTIDHVLSAASQQRVRLVGPVGTAWSGSAELQAVFGPAGATGNNAQQRMLRLPVHWTLEPWHLLLGRAHGTLRLGDAAPAEFRATLKSFELEQLQAHLPASALPPPEQLPDARYGGRVDIDVKRVVWRPERKEIDGQLTWSDATMTLGRAGSMAPAAARLGLALPLGRIQLIGTPDNGGSRWQLQSQGGQARLNGQGQLLANGSGNFEATIDAAGGPLAALLPHPINWRTNFGGVAQ